MPKLVVMLRVKDGIRFVDEWLECFEKIADEIVVLDNGSTDGTDKILEQSPKVVEMLRTTGYNEGRDKNMLYAAVRERKPDWILWLDIDEVFEPELTRADFDKLMNSKTVTRWAFRRFHFINSEQFAGSLFRLNYSAGHDRILWKEQPNGYFENLILDSPNVKGITGLKWGTNFRLKHTGYISKEEVDKKAAIYRGVTSSAEKEANIKGMYMHQEKGIKWIDKRHHPKVVLLNAFLNVLLMRQYFFKAIAKLTGAARQPKPATQA